MLSCVGSVFCLFFGVAGQNVTNKLIVIHDLRENQLLHLFLVLFSGFRGSDMKKGDVTKRRALRLTVLQTQMCFLSNGESLIDLQIMLQKTLPTCEKFPIHTEFGGDGGLCAYAWFRDCVVFADHFQFPFLCYERSM